MKNCQKLLTIFCHQKILFYLSLYIKWLILALKHGSTQRFFVINIHENDNANKTHLKLLCISEIAKRWGGKNIYDLIDK